MLSDALYAAAAAEHIDVTALSLENHPSQDYINIALRHATKQGHLDVEELLLNRGADPNFKSRLFGGATPLHLAAKGGYTNIVKLLLTRGANPNIRNNDGKTPINVARTKAIKDLIQGEIGFREALAEKALTEGFEERSMFEPKIVKIIIEKAFPEKTDH
jgi:ankyrin repeat protein